MDSERVLEPVALPMCTLYIRENWGLVSQLRSQWSCHCTPWFVLGLAELCLPLCEQVVWNGAIVPGDSTGHFLESGLIFFFLWA